MSLGWCTTELSSQSLLHSFQFSTEFQVILCCHVLYPLFEGKNSSVQILLLRIIEPHVALLLRCGTLWPVVVQVGSLLKQLDSVHNLFLASAVLFLTVRRTLSVGAVPFLLNTTHIAIFILFQIICRIVSFKAVCSRLWLGISIHLHVVFSFS